MKLDKKDQTILGQLLDNARQSNKQIGAKVGLSREGVAGRIKRLEKEKIIQSYTTEINLAKMGYTLYALAIKINGNTSDFENYIASNPKIAFAEKTLGKYNFILIIRTKTPYQLNRMVKEIYEETKDSLKELDISISIANYDTQSSFFKKPHLTTTIRETEQIYEPKKLETQIIKELSNNSKISLVDLATKTKVSAVTITEKIKHLKSQDIIKTFRIIIDYKKLGLSRYSLAININPSQEEKLLEFCKNHKAIIDTSEILGNFNYTLEILVKNNEDFRQIVDQITKTFQIQNYEPLILLEEIKHIPKE